MYVSNNMYKLQLHFLSGTTVTLPYNNLYKLHLTTIYQKQRILFAIEMDLTMLMKITVLFMTYDDKLTTRKADESKLIKNVNYFGLVHVLFKTLKAKHIKMLTEWLFLLTNHQSLWHSTFKYVRSFSR